jgi:hypothetical protein
MPDGRVHVLFQNDRETIGRYMSKAAYGSVHTVPATIADCEEAEGRPLEVAPSDFVYHNPSIGLRDALDYDELKMSRADDASTPVDILVMLAKDEDELIRCHVAFNRSAPLWLLVQLARDSDWSVRQHVALNRLTPHEILTELTQDDNQYVRWAAEKTLKYKPHPALGVRYNPDRDRNLWSQATDYVMCCALVRDGLSIPTGANYNPVFDGMSVEQVYEILRRKAQGRGVRRNPFYPM